jgi:hypothetical protein
MAIKANQFSVPESGTGAAHVTDDVHNLHGVGIWKLHVLIVPDGRFWFAQGLEIDYGAQGNTVEDAKDKFSKGIVASIHHHLQMFGEIDGLLRVVPNDVWKDLWKAKKRAKLTYDCASIHQILPQEKADLLPFEGIEFAVESPALAGASA